MNLKIIRDDCHPIAYYVKGHIELDDLRSAVFAETGRRFDELDNVRCYWTWLRMNPCNEEMFNHYVADGTPGNRGSFPATLIQVDGYCTGQMYKEYDRMPEPTATGRDGE